MSNSPTSAYAARASDRVRRVCQTTQTSSQQCVPRLQSVTQRSLGYGLIIVTLAVALGCQAQARESDFPSVNDEGREQAAQLLVERAKRSFNAGDHQAAVNSYSRLLRLKPRDDRVYFNRGLARHKNGDVSGALEDFDAALMLNPELHVALVNRARIYLERDRAVDAFADLARAEALRPGDAAVLFYKATASERIEKLRQSVQDLTKIIDLDASNAPALAERGHLLLRQGHTEAAKADFERALRLDPESARAKSGLESLNP